MLTRRWNNKRLEVIEKEKMSTSDWSEGAVKERGLK